MTLTFELGVKVKQQAKYIPFKSYCPNIQTDIQTIDIYTHRTNRSTWATKIVGIITLAEWPTDIVLENSPLTQLKGKWFDFGTATI